MEAHNLASLPDNLVRAAESILGPGAQPDDAPEDAERFKGELRWLLSEVAAERSAALPQAGENEPAPLRLPTPREEAQIKEIVREQQRIITQQIIVQNTRADLPDNPRAYTFEIALNSDTLSASGERQYYAMATLLSGDGNAPPRHFEGRFTLPAQNASGLELYKSLFETQGKDFAGGQTLPGLGKRIDQR